MRLVRILSLSDPIVLVAITPGTQHPKPSIMGMNDLPLRPASEFITRSMTKAALARYPESSRKVRRRKSMKMFGVNTRTDPTPPITPSARRDPAAESPRAP